MNKILLFVAIVLLGTSAIAQTTTPVKVKCDQKLSTITYSMNHMLHAWTGVSNDVTSIILTDENKSVISQVAVSVKIASFDSQNANRDSHTIEATEALKYPNITFASTTIKPEGDKLKVTGTLTFHSVNQPISFEALKKMNKNKAEITGEFSVKMTQFKIDPPSLMGIATDDEIKIAFKIIY